MRRRDKIDGLPFRVYERYGKRDYSIGFKAASGKWAFRYKCPVFDVVQISILRRKAIEGSAQSVETTSDSFCELVNIWFTWQDSLPSNSTSKRANTTLAENKREAKNLLLAFGHMNLGDLTKSMGYAYLDACTAAGRPEKGNKEIALCRLILEYGIRKGKIENNPFDGLRKNKTIKTRRLVTDIEMQLAIEVGRRLSGQRHIVAMALKTAWLCVRRSVEVRGITSEAIRHDGILWKDGKDKTKPAVLISWSPELKATIDEALAIERRHVGGTLYIFGNIRGERYTKGGWKSMLDDLMRECEAVAVQNNIQFKRFNLQDCRPKGVSDKLERGDLDTQEATGHTSEKMIALVYDRRTVKHAKPAG